MITGSGAQNRDEEIFGFRPFWVIADHLTRHGIAVLRCDDRGVGGSTGSTSQSTSADFADDALAGVKYLQGRPEIDKTRVGLMGHSEGGLVAPMLAARAPDDIAFIVLMSGPGLTEVFPRANHLYQDSETGGVAEYARLKKEFVPGFLDLVSTWITAQPGTAKK